VLVPDLSLLADREELGAKLMLPFMKQAKGFLQLLDPSEFLIHNAGFIAQTSETLTPIMAFDAILLKRCMVAGEQKSPDFRYTLTLAKSKL
jgi:hypothetical protein